jgi:hypothetical protein
MTNNINENMAWKAIILIRKQWKILIANNMKYSIIMKSQQ